MAEEKTFSVGVQTSSPKRISVTSNVSENPITASADTGLYYSQLAKNWAIGEGLIQNEDYSSKFWAGESKSSADLSKMYSEAASLDLNNLENRIIEYDEQLNTTITEGVENINTSVTGGVETIETLQANSIAEITTNKESALSDITTASNLGLNNITTAETNALNNIDTDLNNATSEINTNRANTLAQISTLANTSISDINATAKSYDNLTYRNITNCLLEVPQRIKYDLTDGILTIKAGSEFIVPNEFEEDGITQKFEHIKLDRDGSKNLSSIPDGTYVYLYNVDKNAFDFMNIASVYSETSYITSGGVSYNTAVNNIRIYSTPNTIYCEKASFPFLIFIVSGGSVSVYQVFNGFGFIGKILWVDKDVRGLTAYGKNDDGTYKGKDVKLENVVTRYYSQNVTNTLYFGINSHGEIHLNGERSYDEKTNFIYNRTTAINQFECGTVTISSTGFSHLNPKQPFRAVDYNDVDGEWVVKYAAIASNITVVGGQSYSYDLSTYLPNDGNKYEIIIQITGVTNKTNSNLTCYVSSNLMSDVCLFRITATTNANTLGGGNALIIIGADRGFKINAGTSEGGKLDNISIKAYRKVR